MAWAAYGRWDIETGTKEIVEADYPYLRLGDYARLADLVLKLAKSNRC